MAQHPLTRACQAASLFDHCLAASCACRPHSLSGTGQLWTMSLTIPFSSRAVMEVMQRAFVLMAWAGGGGGGSAVCLHPVLMLTKTLSGLV